MEKVIGKTIKDIKKLYLKTGFKWNNKIHQNENVILSSHDTEPSFYDKEQILITFTDESKLVLTSDCAGWDVETSVIDVEVKGVK